MSDRDDDDDRHRRARRARRPDDEDEHDDRPQARRRRRRDDHDDYDNWPQARRRGDEDEYGDRPSRGQQSQSNGLALAALVLGVFSFACVYVTGIPAVICGILGISAARRTGRGKGMAVTGIVLAVTGTVTMTLVLLWAVTKVRKAAGNAIATNNFKQIGLGLQNHHDMYLKFPSPYHQEPGAAQGDPAEVPKDLAKQLSWRVTILPFIEQASVYQQMKRDEPWDSPANRPLADRFILPYADPGMKEDPTTRNRVFVGPGALFDPTRKEGPHNLATVTDGSSNTILAVEAADKVPWPQYKELPFDKSAPLPALGRPDTQTFLAVFADGSVRAIRKTADPELLKKLITAQSGEIFDFNDLDR